MTTLIVMSPLNYCCQVSLQFDRYTGLYPQHILTIYMFFLKRSLYPQKIMHLNFSMLFLSSSSPLLGVFFLLVPVSSWFIVLLLFSVVRFCFAMQHHC